MSELLIGLMSGTSLDGIDAVLVTDDNPPALIDALHVPFSATLRDRILKVAEDRIPCSLDALGRLDAELGEAFAAAVQTLLAQAGKSAGDILVIGSHGQTVRHRPEGPLGFSLQFGDPNRIAAATGITTVADFRRRDLALGGQGAPLVPAFHAACFRSQEENRAVLNLGGMANLTLLPRAPDRPVMGFDTGPGNVLLDAWHGLHQSGDFDRDGNWAASGKLQPALLEALLEDPFFAFPPPKSTGREAFRLSWLRQRLNERGPLAAADVQATLTELTAVSVADALLGHAVDTERLLVCGGGAHNRFLLQRLGQRLPGVAIESTAAWGLAPDWVEGAAFAWLAGRTLAGQAGNLPTVTGARQPAVLGAIYPGERFLIPQKK